MESKMAIETYIKERVDDQINWYSQKSIDCQRSYKFYKKWIIVLSSAVPIVALFSWEHKTVLMSALSAIVAICTGFIEVGKFQDNWIKYRQICEHLKSHKLLFQMRVCPYNGENSEQLFTNFVESTILNENNAWVENNLCKIDTGVKK
jgi:hypothetical protein